MRRVDTQLAVTLDHLVARRLLDGTDLFIVQIGAFDGRTGDQLHKYVIRYGWRGILVEPQAQAFEELRRTYASSSQLELRNVAISDRNEVRRLYSIRQVPGVPDWAPQAATFDRTRLEDAGFGGAIDVQTVECIPFSELLAGVENVDLLQVDVEGYDAQVIRMFDFDRYRPSIVRFESFHLSRREHDDAVARLVGYGYKVVVTGMDTMGWYE